MNETAQRIPHINHTPELEAAAIAVNRARSGEGTPVALVTNPLDVKKVQEALKGIAGWFEDPNFFFDREPNAALAAAENLVLLATLLREHLKAGNT